MNKPTFTLIIGNKNYSSWSLRPWILMTECGIHFNEELKPFIDHGSWATFRAFSPTGTVPVLIDGKNTVWDSLGIVEYLAEQHANVWPEDHTARAWARCATAEMHAGFSAIRNECNMTVGQRVKLNAISPALEKEVTRINELWEEGLNRFGGDYLAGSKFTAVDAFYAPIVFRARTYSLPLSPKAQAYADRIISLDSMQNWEQEALKEKWREPFHEQETLDVGKVIEDFRAT